MSRITSKITLYEAVPFDDTYKHVVLWDINKPKQIDSFLNLFNHVEQTGSYQALNRPIRWSGKITSYNQLLLYNYAKIDDIDGDNYLRTYYAFITDYQYLNDGTTLLFYSIDAWNTYWSRVHFNTAYIERGFIKDINNDGTDFSDDFKKLTKNTAEEIGGDGCTYLRASNPVYFAHKPLQKGQSAPTYRDDANLKFIVFTTQPKDAQKDLGSLLGAYSEYKYFILAYSTTTAKCYDIYLNGKKITECGGKLINEVYQKLATAKDFAGSDSLVVDSELYDYIGLPFTIDPDNDHRINFQTAKSVQMSNSSTYLTQVQVALTSDFKPQDGIGQPLVKGSNLFVGLVEFLRQKYGQDVPLKMLGNPFMKVYLTDGKGTQQTLDLLKFTKLNTSNILFKRYGALSENGKQVYSVENYNRDTTADGSHFVNYENAMAVDDAQRDTPIILDNYTMYLNANRNQLANTRANAKMNERLAKEGNLLSVNNANRTLNTQMNVRQYQNDRALESSALSTGAKMLTAGLTGGGIAGVAGAALGGVIGMGMTDFNNNTATNALAMNQATQRANMADNYAYQNKVATNNYEQTLRSQNAMLADVRNHNDQVAHQGSAYLFDYENGNNGLHWQLFSCQDSTMHNIENYFKLFGYELNTIDSIEKFLHVKANYNYVRTSNAHINSDAPQPMQDTINSMLNNGVTFWNVSAIDKFAERDQRSNPFN